MCLSRCSSNRRPAPAAARLLVACVALMVCVPLLAQVFLPARRVVPSLLAESSFQPDDISTIRFWWVHSDIATNAVASPWTERIQGNVASQGDATRKPTNTSSGIRFDGANYYLSNNPAFSAFTHGTPTLQNTGAVWVVLTPETPSTANGPILGNDGVLVSGRGLVTTSGGNFRLWGLSGNPTYGTYSSGQTYDILLACTNSAGTQATAFWTNGVLVSGYVTGGDWGETNSGRFGTWIAGSHYFKGYIKEIAFFSNVLDSVTISNLHNYATNRYGYSP